MILRSLLLTVLLASAPAARAVVVAGTTGNTSAPGDDPGFANVGVCNTASCVYLGGQWVLSAYHVNPFGAFPAIFNNVAYPVVGGTVHQLTNNGAGGMSAFTDLVLFQINADPGLPALNISASAPVAGNDLVMIGNGLNREASRTFWQVTMNPGSGNDTWTETPGPHNVEGFKTGAGQAMRWGTNDAEAVNVNVNDGIGDIRSILSLFDDDVLLPNEAQAITYDSGGGVFYKNGGQWELAGIMYAAGSLGNGIGFFDNLPAGVSAFEQSVTFTADLSFYRDQILGWMVPEPSTAVLAGGALALLLRRRRAGGK